MKAAHPVVNLVNDQDEVIGTKDRADIEQTDIYRVAALWIQNSRGDILLAQRKLTKQHDPGMWGPAVAGTVEAGETYIENILKEAYEEIGLQDIQPTESHKCKHNGQWNFFTQWFTLTIDQPIEQFAIQKDEVARIKWFTRHELAHELVRHPEHFLDSISWALAHL